MRDVKDLNKKSDQEAKRLKIYLAAAYGVTFLMGLLMWYELCDSNIGSGGSVIGDSALCNGILYGNASFIVDADAAGAYYRRKHRVLDSPAFDKEGKAQSVWIVLEQERGIMVLHCFVCGGLSL